MMKKRRAFEHGHTRKLLVIVVSCPNTLDPTAYHEATAGPLPGEQPNIGEGTGR